MNHEREPSMTTFNESDVETAAPSWLSSLGWQTAYGPDLAPDAPGAERTDFTQVVLEERLRDALLKLNSSLPLSTPGTAYANSSTRKGRPWKPGTGPPTTPSSGE